MKVDLKTEKDICNKENRVDEGGNTMIKTEIVQNTKCQFCGKDLKRKRLYALMGDKEFIIDGEEERCTCIQAKDYWRNIDLAREKNIRLEELRVRQERIRRMYAKSKMRPRLREYTFSRFEITKDNEKAFMKAKEYAKDIEDGSKKSLFITGNIGTGKTHLAASIANYLIGCEIQVIFGTLINLLNEVKESYTADDMTELSIIDNYSKVPLLIIDDLGKERPSEWTLEKLFTIINNRYENNLPVVITTNYNRDRLRERLANRTNYEIADAIISRLYEMCKGINIKGTDKRKELV